MNDLISQLFDIATNEEFSPDQRRMLMRIALNEFSDGNDPIGSIDGPIHVLGSNGTDDCIATIAVEPEPSPSSFVLDAALGRHLTKDRLADGTLRLGLAAHLPPSE